MDRANALITIFILAVGIQGLCEFYVWRRGKKNAKRDQVQRKAC